MRNPSRYTVHAGATVYTQWMVKPSAFVLCWADTTRWVLNGQLIVCWGFWVIFQLPSLGDMFADNYEQDIRIVLMWACVSCVWDIQQPYNYFIHYDFDSLLEVYLVEYIIDDLHDVKNTKTHQRAAVLDYNERTWSWQMWRDTYNASWIWNTTTLKARVSLSVRPVHFQLYTTMYKAVLKDGSTIFGVQMCTVLMLMVNTIYLIQVFVYQNLNIAQNSEQSYFPRLLYICGMISQTW